MGWLRIPAAACASIVRSSGKRRAMICLTPRPRPCASQDVSLRPSWCPSSLLPPAIAASLARTLSPALPIRRSRFQLFDARPPPAYPDVPQSLHLTALLPPNEEPSSYWPAVPNRDVQKATRDVGKVLFASHLITPPAHLLACSCVAQRPTSYRGGLLSFAGVDLASSIVSRCLPALS